MERDYLVLLRDVGEALALMSGDNIDAFLQRIVALVNTHIRTDVASVYLYDSASQELVLRATRGLAPESVGRVRLRLGEGLVGHVLETLEPVCERAASQNPHFKYFPEIREEPFESFLAVPLHRGAERMGVLVAQRCGQDFFGPQDVLALQILASQLASAIENTRALTAPLPRPAAAGAAPVPSLVRGRVVSEGYAYARAVRFDPMYSRRRLATARFEGRYTLAQFEAALESTDAELVELQRRFASDLPELAALVFTAHQMMLMDAQFAGTMRSRIEAGENPPEAIVAVARECMDRFAAHPYPYLRDKAADVADLAARLLDKLMQKPEQPGVSCTEAIATARELHPSDVLELYAHKARGIILTHGGETSHVVLLSRSLGIPLVIADHPALLELPEGTRVLLDAEIGNIYVNPTEAVLNRFRARDEARMSAAHAQMKSETRTRDGTRIHLLANINLLSETRLARELKAEGVGLYRSEFPFLVRPAFPSEEEQVIIYTRLVQEMPDRMITVRTLDIGGDKEFAWHMGEREENPQLGLRSIRFSLYHPELFREQLRAILRGGAGAQDLRIVFPMIGSLEEFRAARAAVDSAIASLAQEGLPHHPNPKLGMMVEVPSVIPLIGEFARAAEFFSLGTNDLVQYLLGVDRGNEKVAAYFRLDHPAVLRAISQVVETVRRSGKDLSICGEMAHKPEFLPFFLGIGVRALSVDPRYLPTLQAAIEGIDLAEAERIAEQVQRCSTLEEVQAILVTPYLHKV